MSEPMPSENAPEPAPPQKTPGVYAGQAGFLMHCNRCGLRVQKWFRDKDEAIAERERLLALSDAAFIERARRPRRPRGRPREAVPLSERALTLAGGSGRPTPGDLAYLRRALGPAAKPTPQPQPRQLVRLSPEHVAARLGVELGEVHRIGIRSARSWRDVTRDLRRRVLAGEAPLGISRLEDLPD